MKRTNRLRPDKESRNYARAIYLLMLKKVRGEISPEDQHLIGVKLGQSRPNGVLVIWKEEFNEPLWD